MRGIRTVFVGACVAAASLSPTAAPAHGDGDAHDPVGSVVRTLPLHLDRVVPGAQGGDVVAASGGGGCLPLPRSVSDRPDFETGPQVHVVYMVPADASDGRLDTDGTLECSIRAQNQWFAAQSEGLEWRFDTFLTEATIDGQRRTVAVPDITFVQSPQPARNLSDASGVSRELRARGFDDPGKRYLTYVAAGNGGTTCGDAYYPIPRLDAPWSGQYAQVYVNAASGCGTNRFGVPGAPSYSESVAQQELMHNDGMTPIGAPHSCLNGSPPGFAHVCTGASPISSLDPERFDVMYPFAGVALSDKKLDIGHDDYFRHSLPLDDLEGSPFLRPVSARPTVPQGGQPPPSADPTPTPPPSTEPTPAPTPSPTATPTPAPSETPSPSPSPSPSAQPEQEPAAAERSVTLEASSTTVAKGERVRFSGRVSGEACTAGVEVVLEARRPSEGSFRAVATIYTAADGELRVRLRVRQTRIFRAVVPAAEGCASAASPEVKVRVSRG